MKNKKVFSKRSMINALAILTFLLTLFMMRRYEFGSHNNGLEKLDMRFGYSAGDVNQLLTDLGREGRAIYIKILIVDFIFIGSFLIIQNNLLKYVMGKAMLNSRWHYFLSISYMRAFFDFVENVLIILLINNFPNGYPQPAGLLGYITELKFICLGLWLAAIPVLLFVRRIIMNKAEYMNRD